MHVIEFIEDLAVIMLIAGFISVLFHRLKQPVVLGYILAGVIVGPNTPPFSFIHDLETIKTLAQLGVVFLMFSLGLQFSIRSLSKVGMAVTFTALAEIVLMIWLGYEIGAMFHWRTIDSIFLGAILAISSTTIIVKALYELGLQKEKFVQLVFGILIVEDILGIAILGILSSIAISGSVDAGDIMFTMVKLIIFLIVVLVVGLLTVPRLITYVAKFHSNEMLLITILGLCFGVCLLVIKLDYSVALGAFIIGAIMAECKELKRIDRLIEPLRDMFSAIFFVSVGLLLNPQVVIDYALPILVITFAVVFGKVISCSLGTLLVGKDGRTALRVGMGLAQIGEFSFIIATLGISLNVTSDYLFPIVVAVSVITTFLTPYLIRLADPLSKKLSKILPERIVYVFNIYAEWIRNIRPKEENKELSDIFHKGLFQIFINICLVSAIFWGGSYFATTTIEQWLEKISYTPIQKMIIWGLLLILSLPFLIAIYRKVKMLSLLLADISVKRDQVGQYTQSVRMIVAEVIPVLAICGMMFLIIVLSAGILPPPQLFLLVLAIVLLILLLLRSWFFKLYVKLQLALAETMKNDGNQGH